MKVEEYIASGILESYVLGGLNPIEIQEVERMIAEYPEIKKELLSLQGTLESYAESFAMKPRAELKNKILSSIPYQTLVVEEPKVNRIHYYKYATAASVALMIICGGLAALYWSKWQSAEQRLTVLEQESSSYANQINKTNFKIDQLAENLSLAKENLKLVKDTSVVKVIMKGVGVSPSSLSMVFWNKSTNEVFIDPGNLPEAPQGMQYQLWAIADGQPLDAGVFEMDLNQGLQKVNSIKSAEAYAVTLEKIGGSKVPTLSAMYVFGKV